MAGLQLIVLGLLSSCLTLSAGSTHLCVSEGGRCVYRYEGCEEDGVIGKIVDGLCDGPDYYQCCVVIPLIDEEALNRPKSRNCHQCSYAVSRGRELGDLECLSWKNQGAELGTVNCTGMCSKELLTLDKDNFELVRRCSLDCHEDGRNPLYNVHCCWGDLCNHATRTATAAWLPLGAILLKILLG